ncbi:hypothetical protein E0L36_15365 [Streptomyces sp. AJS327]|uniref:hypothetical protein n=1 Tax=Streptomyces sp. AJS327 TaxID=2545265 RepID=UPI0015DEBC82|nr:hypothetical protein [Streptomyces sp. AJS327]MBA0052232.1 hypothetical protein [Streptomyces sp. AJS327]
MVGGHARRARELDERPLAVAAERAYGQGEIRAEIGPGLAARLDGDTEASRRHLNRAWAESRSSGHAAGAGWEPALPAGRRRPTGAFARAAGARDRPSR